MGVVVPAGQLGYGAGHVICWFAQTRGVTSVSHVEPAFAQLVQAAPPEPHEPLVKPSAHALAGVQQPAQLAGPHFGVHTRAVQTAFPGVQSLHCAPFCPHAASCVPSTHVLPEQQPAQLAGPHAGT